MKMRLGDTRYICVKCAYRDGKYAGQLTLTGHAWGYQVQLHWNGEAGYPVNETFQRESAAKAFFDKVYEEVKKP